MSWTEEEPPTKKDCPSAAEHPTVRLPVAKVQLRQAGAPCGVPGFEGVSALTYAREIGQLVREGNFGLAEARIRKAREAGVLGLIRIAHCGKL